MQPALLDELAALKARTGAAHPDAPVFASATGRPLRDDNVRSRVFAPAVKRANERRAERELPPLPEHLTPYSLRRTYISALLALGWEVPAVMAEVGHADPKVTLGIYAQVMRRDEGARERLRTLFEGRLKGSSWQWEAVEGLEAAALAELLDSETPADTGVC